MRARLFVALLGCGCSLHRQDQRASTETAPIQAEAAPPAASLTPAVVAVAATVASSQPAPEPADVACSEVPSAVGRVQDPRLVEISGIVQSRRDPRVFLVHNDSGDSPRLFAIDRSGQLLSELVLETVPVLIDAEDIAIGPSPAGVSYVYLGDTGNNFASSHQGIPRRKAVLYRFEEPAIDVAWRARRVALREVFPIVFTFPDGARDVEAFVIDPRTGDLVIVSKQADGNSQILTASAAQLAAGGGQLKLAGNTHFGSTPLGSGTMPTAASVARDGLSLLVRTYRSVLRFRRAAGETLAQALTHAAESVPSPSEPQGEAITFVDDDSAFLTISEGPKPPIYCTRLPITR